LEQSAGTFEQVARANKARQAEIDIKSALAETSWSAGTGATARRRHRNRANRTGTDKNRRHRLKRS